jgi:hypothetical protein
MIVRLCTMLFAPRYFRALLPLFPKWHAVRNARLKNQLMKNILIVFGLFMMLVSCDENEKFESDKWKTENGSGAYPHRAKMLDDIITNRKFVGMKYKALRNVLGNPSSIKQNEVRYNIESTYSNSSSRAYTKDLVLFINADSVVVQMGVSEEGQS